MRICTLAVLISTQCAAGAAFADVSVDATEPAAGVNNGDWKANR